jgi:molybdopterin-containing oxidoreductase family iron-sulfur binding subunit
MPLPEGYWPENEHDMYPPVEPVGHRWAMTIDLSKCTGCGACAVACQAENNVANVGIDEVERGHEMHWLRIDRYFEPSEDTPVLFQPMLCQHCDQAPCEPVCPVFAAVHNEEGLNAQVYNRCVGTRYCANNCPYKVRRFNWFEWEFKEPLNRQLNPDVTVRCRGVMEKCTFCIQRIREVQYRARAEDRPVRDGEVRPACVQTCPTGALVFGDLLNPEARVTEIIRHDPRAYQVLHHFNTKPGVIYLKRVIQA